MKKSIYIIICTTFILSSCADLLDKKPIDIISQDVVWSDPVLAEKCVNGILEQMNFLFNEVSNSNGVHWFDMHDVITMSDEARHSFPWYYTYTSWGRGLITESGGVLENWPYGLIRSSNEAIEYLTMGNLPEEQKNALIMRARWCRAMCYFTLVKRYGGVPLIIRAQQPNDPQDELFRKRNQEFEVYDFIIKEMDEIAPQMADRDKGGYPSKWAAYALKSRAALYAASIATWGKVQIDGLAGIPQDKANYFWEACYNASDKIIKEGKFALYNKYPEDKVKNFRQLFVDENANPEAIMVLQFFGKNGVARDHGWDIFTAPQGFTLWAGSCVGVYLEMVEEFENIDGSPGKFDREKYEQGLWTSQEIFANKEPRFFASVLTQSSPYQGSRVEYYNRLQLPDGSFMTGTNVSYKGVPASGKGNIEGGGVTGFTAIKGVNESKIGPDSYGSDTDWFIYRLGEIYLNQAEAAFELGKTDVTLQLVNAIRERAGVKMHSAIDRDKIRHERKIELAFESNRWFDLRRWRIAKETISRPFKGLSYTLDFNSYKEGNPKYMISVIDKVDGSNQKNFPEKMYYLPITKSRISNNPNLAPENPGY